ncbi:uncharacterized protein LOC127244398 isoform X2 [Andrographis paniculata]|uniref:uncharacterized protein LOC127244398 isoform X2 n=1 Tax=Andrographis paniculata TaxID=175694 RepID=UPI0021E88618|nr:uncharacterized protein LOC127244398 isoform X2 [Andrographis paniculata]
MKIQPVDFNLPEEPPPVPRPQLRSRFWRLFEWQFSSVLRIPPAAPVQPIGSCSCSRDGSNEFEPSTAGLARMVQSFIEGSSERQPHRCGYRTDNSDDDPDSSSSSPSDVCDLLKSLVPCFCVSERNLLADAAHVIDRSKIGKRKDDSARKIFTDGLISLGYNASICRSNWEKSISYPCGEYEYVEVIIGRERYIVDIEFRSEFEVARATKAYREILQTLPSIFVGQSKRLKKIITIVSEAARQSLKKEGMPFPPWRKPEYVKAKWLSPYTRIYPCSTSRAPISRNGDTGFMLGKGFLKSPFLGREYSAGEPVFVLSESEESNEGDTIANFGGIGKGKEKEKEKKGVVITGNCLRKGVKIVTGLASVTKD